MQLYLDLLLEKSSPNAVRAALKELPHALNEIYDESLKRIKDKDKDLAYQVFSWLVHAYRPLSLVELQYALSVKEGMTKGDLHDELFISSICAGLITVRQECRMYGFSRQTVEVVGFVRQCSAFGRQLKSRTNHMVRLHNARILQ